MIGGWWMDFRSVWNTHQFYSSIGSTNTNYKLQITGINNRLLFITHQLIYTSPWTYEVNKYRWRTVAVMVWYGTIRFDSIRFDSARIGISLCL